MANRWRSSQPRRLALYDGVAADRRPRRSMGARRGCWPSAQNGFNLGLARASYTDALDLCANEVEREHLAARLDALDSTDA